MSKLLPLVALALLSCKPDPDGTGEDTDAGPGTSLPPGAFETTANVSDVIPTVVFVSWSADQAGATSWVEYGLDGALDRSTPQAVAEGTDHEITLLGLKSGREYSYKAIMELPDGTRLESSVGTVSLAVVPADLPSFELLTKEPASQVQDGFVMVSMVPASGPSWVVILDGDADVVWYAPSDDNRLVVTSRPGLDRQSVLWGQYDAAQKEDYGELVRLSLDGRERTVTRTVLAHHDFLEHTDGTMAWIGYVYHPTEAIVSDAIFEANEATSDTTSARQIYNWFEDPAYDWWYVCEHMNNWVSDASYGEWTHSNSLMSDASGDHYYLMSKFHDTLVKIDRATGAIVWQMNGEHGDFTLPDGSNPWTGLGDSALWSHAHMSHVWDGGMVLFDNGYHYLTGEVSRASEYAWNESTMTVEKVWEYAEPEGKFTKLMGDVRKLDGGNYLIGWSTMGRMDEVTPGKEVVWSAGLGIGAVSGRVRYIEDLYVR